MAPIAYAQDRKNTDSDHHIVNQRHNGPHCISQIEEPEKDQGNQQRRDDQ
jgi:hypothetical protein